MHRGIAEMHGEDSLRPHSQIPKSSNPQILKLFNHPHTIHIMRRDPYMLSRHAYSTTSI